MVGKKKLVAFVATEQPKRAKRFYSDKLGLRLVGESPFALEYNANGIMLRVAIVQEAVIALGRQG